MKMSKWLKRVSAFLLAAVLAVLPAFQTISYAGEKEKHSKEYLKGLFSRFEAYDQGDVRYEDLLNDDFYYCSSYANQLHYITHDVKYEWQKSDEKGFWAGIKNFGKNFVGFSKTLDRNAVAELKGGTLWAAQNLTETDLDESAYIDYLSKILAMHEKGFLETARSQAKYEVRVSTGKELFKIADKAAGAVLADKNIGDFKAKVADICGKDTVKSMEATLKEMKNGREIQEFMKAFQSVVKDEAEAEAFALYASIHKERLAFLNVLYENSKGKEHKNLHKAAKAMIDASNMRLMGLIHKEYMERTKNLSKMTAMATGKEEHDLEKWAEGLMDYVSTCSKELAEKLENQFASEILTGVSVLTSNASLIKTGFEIGGFVGRIFWGERYEQGRAILISNEVTQVLEGALPGLYQDCKKTKGDEKRYNALHSFVAAAEALCYVRVNGEYTALEFVRGEEGAPSDGHLDYMYQDRCEYLDARYTALSEIFPEPPVQVAVYVNREIDQSDVGPVHIIGDFAFPQVSIEGNEKAAKKITESPDIKALQDGAKKELEEMKEFSGDITDSNMSGMCSSNLRLDDAHVSGQALSLCFWDISYYVMAAHPMFFVSGFTYDTDTGERLELEDVLDDTKPGEAKKKLHKLLAKSLGKDEGLARFTHRTMEEIIEQEFLDTDFPEMRERHWYFSQEGFTIIFDVYQIAPYAGGCITATVPYEDLGGIIKEQYLPEKTTRESGGRPKIYTRKTLEEDYPERDRKVFGDAVASVCGVVTEKTAYDVTVKCDYRVKYYTNCFRPGETVWLEDLYKASEDEVYKVECGNAE